jgi:hypothetical protein
VLIKHELYKACSFESGSENSFERMWCIPNQMYKSDKSKIPPYLKDQSMHIISYVYTRPIASKKYNYKHVLRDLNIDDFKSKYA